PRGKTKPRRRVKRLRRNSRNPIAAASNNKKSAVPTRRRKEALKQQKAASKRETVISRELSEALEREKATSEVLGIISSSPSDLKRVFETILANATRLCEASYGALWLCEGDAIRLAALHGSMPAAYAAERRPGAVFRRASGPMARALRTRQTVQVADLRAE